MTEPLLKLQDLYVTFTMRRGVLYAVNGLSLNVNRGEILGLVGESGSGKSMTGAAIMGLIEPPGRISGGEVWFAGKRIDQDPAPLRGKDIAMVFQDPLTSLDPLQTVGDQLVETIMTHLPVSHVEALERAKRGLAEVGIDPERYRAYPHAFSGGMRQRVVVALALAAEPKLIIADEPTTALDVSVQAQVLELLKTLCKERETAVILITHDMAVIAETTDRVAVLYAGRLVEVGKTAQVLYAPNHPYTHGLVASTPSIDLARLAEDFYQIPGSMPSLDQLPSGCAFHPRCTRAFVRCDKEVPRLLPLPDEEGAAACWLLDNPETQR